MLGEESPELKILLIIPGHVVNVCQDAVEDVGDNEGGVAEVGQAAQDQVPSLGHSQTIRDSIIVGETRLKDLKMCLLVISNLKHILFSSFRLQSSYLYLFSERCSSR